MPINVQVEGATHLAAALSDKQNIRVMRVKSLLEAVDLLEKAAQTLVPVKRGKLKKSIKGYVYQSGEKAYVKAGTKHAHLVEYGTKAHTIEAGKARKRGKTRRALLLPGGILRRSAQHPGAKESPFLHPALERNMGEINRILEKHGHDLMVKIARVR